MGSRYVDVNDLEKYAVVREDGHRYVPWVAIAEVRTAACAIPHGTWELSDIPCEGLRCSVCGGGAWYFDYRGNISRSSYCPNCGAKMDGGVRHE